MGWLLSALGHYFPSVAVLSPVFKDPFTIIAGLILVASYTDLHYMEFKLRHGQPSITFDLDPLERQKVIPKRYEDVYGTDLFVKAWKVRLVFVGFFLIACVRWVLTWKAQ
jgi:hypothetical protein